MKVSDVINVIQNFAPFESQMGFDNAGLLIGSAHQKVHKIGVVLDVTPEAVEQAVLLGADCIVSHHPIIFSGLKSIPCDSAVYLAVRHGVSVVSAHTNLDAAVGGVNDALASTLGLTEVTALALPNEPTPPLGRMGVLSQPMTDAQFAAFVGNRLNTRVKYVPTPKIIRRVAVCGGAGADFMVPAMVAEADALVTSEIKHHLLWEASHADFMLVDAGHYETEQVVIKPLSELLAQKLSVEVTVLEQSSPVRYC